MGMHMAAMNASNSALVLKEKEINANGPCYIRLSGRKQGFWSWLMTLLGINVTTTLEVYEDRIERSFGSLSGFINETIPIANSLCSYSLCNEYIVLPVLVETPTSYLCSSNSIIIVSSSFSSICPCATATRKSGIIFFKQFFPK